MKKIKKLKKLQVIRFIVQILGMVLVISGFIINASITKWVLIGITVLAGPIYCGWLCPYGFLQDIFSKLGMLLRIRKRKMPRMVHRVLLLGRYVLLAFILLVSSDLIFSLMSYDPRTNWVSQLMGYGIDFSAWAILIGFLIISLFFERPFCNYLCTEGAKYGLYSLLRPITIKRDEATCVHCGKCDKSCPMNIDISGYGQVRSPQCINCLECVESCPVKDTLEVRVTLFEKKTRKILIPLMTLASFLFVGYWVLNNNTDVFSSTRLDQGTEIAMEASTTQAIKEEITTNTENKEDTREDDDHFSEGSRPGRHGRDDVKDQQTAQLPTTATTTAIEEGTTEPSVAITTEDVTTAEVIKTTEDVTTEQVITTTEVTTQTEVVTTEAATQEVTSTTSEVVTEAIPVKVFGDAAGIADGTYTGSGRGFRGYTTVEVTVQNETITQIIATSTNDDRQWFIRAYNTMVSRILGAQSTSVDTVSGATYSSRGIQDAVADALANAGN